VSVQQGLPELFPGFETRRIGTSGGQIHCRIGGGGPPLLLLHGYPQTHAMWHKVAPVLSEKFQLVIADLPGYGASDIPKNDSQNTPFSKRAMAHSLIELMVSLGHERFLVVGHDRGARVTYRMAVDHPERIQAAAVVDILPTASYWDRMDREFALKIYHWAFLAQPSPLPETLISAEPITYLEHTLASWTAAQDLTCFSESALSHYLAAFADPDRVAAACNDYRAGAYIDFDHDKADEAAGRKIKPPLLAVWGGTGIAENADSPLTAWQRWAESVQGASVPSGHFVPEENPDGLLALLLPFLAEHRP